MVQSGWLHGCDRARAPPASFGGGRARGIGETRVWETRPGPPRAGRAELQKRRRGRKPMGLGKGKRAKGPRRSAEPGLVLQAGCRGAGGRAGTLTLALAAAVGRRPAAQTEPAQGGPATSVGRSGGGQARQHPGGAKAPIRTPPPASATPPATTDSIDRTPANSHACAATGGPNDREMVTSFSAADRAGSGSDVEPSTNPEAGASRTVTQRPGRGGASVSSSRFSCVYRRVSWNLTRVVCILTARKALGEVTGPFQASACFYFLSLQTWAMLLDVGREGGRKDGGLLNLSGALDVPERRLRCRTHSFKPCPSTSFSSNTPLCSQST